MSIHIDSNELPWRPSTFCKGVQVKDLGKSDSFCLQLVKFDPGVVFPIHKHHGPEFIYLLQGVAIQYGKQLSPGFVGVSPAGTEEADFRSETGCIFLLFYKEE